MFEGRFKREDRPVSEGRPTTAGDDSAPIRVGDRGVTVTTLRPTGRVRLATTGGKVDVRSDRGWIDVGAEVVFVRREGFDLIVRLGADYAGGAPVPAAGAPLTATNEPAANRPEQPAAADGRGMTEQVSGAGAQIDGFSGRKATADGGLPGGKPTAQSWRWRSVAAGAAVGVIMLVVDGRTAEPLAAAGAVAMTGAWGAAMGWLHRWIHRGALPDLRAALVWLFALLGFAAGAIIALPRFGALPAAAIAMVSSAAAAGLVYVLEILVIGLHE